jgi:hypothetical protein
MLGPCGEEEEDSEPDHCYATDVHGVPPSVGVSANPSHSLAASLLTKREDCQSNSALTGRNAMSEIESVVQHSKPWRHRGRGNIEPKEAERDVEQATPVRGVRVLPLPPTHLRLAAGHGGRGPAHDQGVGRLEDAEHGSAIRTSLARAPAHRDLSGLPAGRSSP